MATFECRMKALLMLILLWSDKIIVSNCSVLGEDFMQHLLDESALESSNQDILQKTERRNGVYRHRKAFRLRDGSDFGSQNINDRSYGGPGSYSSGYDDHHGHFFPVPVDCFTSMPTEIPTSRPTPPPTKTPRPPTSAPTAMPTTRPTMTTQRPSRSPTRQPKTSTSQPSRRPTLLPSKMTQQPTGSPTLPGPTQLPTVARNVTGQPSRSPTRQPSKMTRRPTGSPTLPGPTQLPTVARNVTGQPSRSPTRQPSKMTRRPTGSPTLQGPTQRPTVARVCNPPITPAQRQEQLFQLITANISDPLTVLNPMTPQNSAFVWLSLTDPAQVCPEDNLDVIQRYVLAVLYFSTTGASWLQCNALQSPTVAPCASDEIRWLSGSNVCIWFGIMCDEEDGDVTRITLVNNNLNGSIPSEISALNQLEAIDWMDNLFINSSLPTTIGDLDSLREFNVRNNALTGTVPDQIYDAETLVRLTLSKNRFEGTVSNAIADLQFLDIFEIEANRASGVLPLRLPDSLRFFVVNENLIEGPLPDSYAANTNLRVFAVGSNLINGTIPSYIATFTNLETINFANNSMSGTIPEMGNLINLENLFLHQNNFVGTMPQSICSLRLNQLTADCLDGMPVNCSCCTLCF